MVDSEEELFYPIRRYFSALGYAINSEVENKWGYKRADIILTKENSDELIGIELKRSLSFKLLEQGDYWKKYTDKNYVAIPKTKTQRPRVVHKIFDYLGFGLIEVDLERYNHYYKNVSDDFFVFTNNEGKPDLFSLGIKFVYPALDNKPRPRNKKALQSVIYPEHQTWSVAGETASGHNYVSGYKLLMNEVYTFLRSKYNAYTEGWTSMTEIVNHIKRSENETIKNHYKNTRSGIIQAFERYESGDIEKMTDGKTLYYRVSPESTKYVQIERNAKK